MSEPMNDARLQWLRVVAVACSVVFGLGLGLAWWDGVRLDRLVLLLIAWVVLVLVCWWLRWHRVHGRPDG
mgnify:CR=1 FL=1|jgi:hypothetical protein